MLINNGDERNLREFADRQLSNIAGDTACIDHSHYLATQVKTAESERPLCGTFTVMNARAQVMGFYQVQTKSLRDVNYPMQMLHQRLRRIQHHVSFICYQPRISRWTPTSCMQLIANLSFAVLIRFVLFQF